MKNEIQTLLKMCDVDGALPLIYYPHASLRLQSKSVLEFNDDLKQIVDALIKTAKKHQAIGLAANQVNFTYQIAINNVAMHTMEFENAPVVWINPKIIAKSQQISAHEEGCLSIKGANALIDRPAIVSVQAQHLDGSYFEYEATGLLATCIQHEIDHLNGVLFFDYLSKLKRDRILKKITKANHE